jgi:hypothetical protein
MTEISAVGLNQYADPRLAFLAGAAERLELVEGGVMEIDDIVAKLERVEAA